MLDRFQKKSGIVLRINTLLIMALIAAGLAGCVELDLKADKSKVLLGETATLTVICDPPDSQGTYVYWWFCVDAPEGSQYDVDPWVRLDSATDQQVFRPDMVGTYTLESKVFRDNFQGANIAEIQITCENKGAWTIEPTAIDFGYIQTENSEITITNTGLGGIDVAIDDGATAGWVTQLMIGIPAGKAAYSMYDTTIPEGGSDTVFVQVDRTGLEPGSYSTSFVVTSLQCGRKTIDISMSVGRANILFSVDTSGSMEENDPDDMRVDAVMETIDKFYSNEWVEFGIIDFDGDAEMLTDFTRDRATLTSEANKLGDDNGWTTYLGQGDYDPGALDVIDTMVDGNDTQTQYVVIFVSDGEPTQGNTDSDAIVEKTADLAGPDHVKLYTIYLNGDPELAAETLLNDMADAGGTGNVLVITDPDYLSFIDLKF